MNNEYGVVQHTHSNVEIAMDRKVRISDSMKRLEDQIIGA